MLVKPLRTGTTSSLLSRPLLACVALGAGASLVGCLAFEDDRGPTRDAPKKEGEGDGTGDSSGGTDGGGSTDTTTKPTPAPTPEISESCRFEKAYGEDGVKFETNGDKCKKVVIASDLGERDSVVILDVPEVVIPATIENAGTLRIRGLANRKTRILVTSASAKPALSSKKAVFFELENVSFERAPGFAFSVTPRDAGDGANVRLVNVDVRRQEWGAYLGFSNEARVDARKFAEVSNLTFDEVDVPLDMGYPFALDGIEFGKKGFNRPAPRNILRGEYYGVAGTFSKGIPYQLVSFHVRRQAQLALGAGTIIKLNPGEKFLTNGIVDIRGTAAEPVIVTTYRDMTAGGDTNGTGAAAAPAPNDAVGIQISADGDVKSTVKGQHLEVRYLGVGISRAELALANSTFKSAATCRFYGGSHGGDCSGEARDTAIYAYDVASVTLSDTSFSGIPGWSIKSINTISYGEVMMSLTNISFERGIEKEILQKGRSTVTLDGVVVPPPAGN